MHLHPTRRSLPCTRPHRRLEGDVSRNLGPKVIPPLSSLPPEGTRLTLNSELGFALSGHRGHSHTRAPTGSECPGPDLNDDLESFARTQAVFRDLVARTTLPRREFDITGNDVGRVADEVADGSSRPSGCG